MHVSTFVTVLAISLGISHSIFISKGMPPVKEIGFMSHSQIGYYEGREMTRLYVMNSSKSGK